MELVANIIFTLHVILAVFLIITPFIPNIDPVILLLHAITVPFILIHWVTNEDTCCLTTLEQMFRSGTQKSELFFQRLVGSVYQPQSYATTIGMIGLGSVSVYRSYVNKDTLKKRFSLSEPKKEK